MNSSQLLNRLYPKAIKRRCRALKAVRGAGRWARKNALSFGLGAGLIVLWIVGHLYYYNLLVDLEFDVQEAWAQVETQWQRRYHIQQNVTLIVGEYARHERELMLKLTSLREQQQPPPEASPADALGRSAAGGAQAPGAASPAGGAGPAGAGGAGSAGGPAGSAAEPRWGGEASGLAQSSGAPGSRGAAAPSGPATGAQLEQLLGELDPQQLNKLFPQIRLVAEQYPQLRASENFQQFTGAIVDTETKIAEQVMGYNKAVNIYTTELQQFPANIFGKICGFDLYQFYSPERESLRFRELSYGAKR